MVIIRKYSRGCPCPYPWATDPPSLLPEPWPGRDLTSLHSVPGFIGLAAALAPSVPPPPPHSFACQKSVIPMIVPQTKFANALRSQTFFPPTSYLFGELQKSLQLCKTKYANEFDHVPKILRLIFLSIIFRNPETGQKWPTPNPPPFPAAPTEKAEALISAIQLDSTSSNPIAAEDGAAVCVALAPPGVRRVLWQSKNDPGSWGGGLGAALLTMWEGGRASVCVGRGLTPLECKAGEASANPPLPFTKLWMTLLGCPNS